MLLLKMDNTPKYIPSSVTLPGESLILIVMYHLELTPESYKCIIAYAIGWYKINDWSKELVSVT